MKPDSRQQERDRMRLAGEQSVHHVCEEWDLKPSGRVWTDWLDPSRIPSSSVSRWYLPLYEQHQLGGGKLSKTQKNMGDVLRRKERRG